MWQRTENQIALVLIAGVLASTAVVAGWQFAGQPLDETTAQLFTRYSARVSFLFSLPVFVASAMYQLFPSNWTRSLVRYRRQTGLAFALAHTIHLVAIVVYFDVTNAWFTLGDIPALLIYLFVGLMAVTSNTVSVRNLGPIWRYIHKIGLYGVFIGFFTTYLGRVQSFGNHQDSSLPLYEPFAAYLVLLVLVSLAWVLRIVAFWKKRVRQGPKQPASPV